MNEEKAESTEHNEHGTQAVVVEEPKAPEMTAAGLRIYPTSFTPAKAHIETSRIPTAKLSGLEIEVAHVVIFVLLTVFLFIGMWKRAGQR
ncbi:MAG: hypothetical protein K2Q18_07395 [Bdellovibrionales bacterium]|nr:hypothetical protein [Bdellovibrionales bacterium]